ncbi:lectin like domain-containing protein [Eubacterium oxidoreducens]|nr:lectin like domain-containing protein [Eubacterium oxidoreducens]
MKKTRRFIVLGIVALAIVYIQYNHLYEKAFQLQKDEEIVAESKSYWHSIMAAYANEQDLTLSIDKENYTSADGLYVSEELEVMMPVDMLRECFACSAHIYNKKKLVVDKGTTTFTVKLQADSYCVNGENHEAEHVLEKKQDTYYVSTAVLSEVFGYTYKWDAKNNMATIVSGDNEIEFPKTYDLREEGRTGEILNQGAYGTCWAFAALSSMESILLPENSQQFSVDHMSISNSFSSNQYDGGDYTMGMAYLTAWQGPVLEEDDPYGDGKSEDSLEAVYHVQEIQLITDKDYDAIKQAVMLYGGVQTSIYNSMTNGYSSNAQYSYYNKSYYYNGDARPNHDIVIVGWDDDYSKENFVSTPEGDGAFICQNSWGKSFGDDGFFYVSYYDTNIGNNNVVYTGIEAVDNYDSIYQSDLCGWVGQIGYGSDSVYGANIYTAKEDESLSAVGFYVTSEDTDYEVYAVQDYENTDSLDDAILLASGNKKNSGYYTVDFSQKLHLEKGHQFAVMIKISAPDNDHPLAIEYRADNFSQDAIITDGEGYISISGKDWVSVEETYSCNLCIKAYTDK